MLYPVTWLLHLQVSLPAWTHPTESDKGPPIPSGHPKVVKKESSSMQANSYFCENNYATV